MIKEQQAKFYHALGSLITQRRVQMSMTVHQLCKLSGEQNKTIRSIESGRPCSMHHLKWINEQLSIDVNKVLDHMENYNGKKEEESKKDDLIGSLI